MHEKALALRVGFATKRMDPLHSVARYPSSSISKSFVFAIEVSVAVKATLASSTWYLINALLAFSVVVISTVSGRERAGPS